MGEGRSVLVVGGGVVGLCAAHYLRRAGHQVTVIERGAPDHDGCSLGNAGMVVPSHFIPLAAPGMVQLGLRMLLNPEGPFAIPPRPSLDLLRWAWLFQRSANAAHVKRSAPVLRDLGLASRALFVELEAELGGFGLAREGLLMLCKEAATLREEAEVAERAHALGIAAEVLTPDAAAALDPAMRMDVAGAVYFPLDCHLDPSRLLTALTQHVQEAGVEIRWRTELRGWRAEDGRITGIDTDRGPCHADDYVLAAGSWSGELLRGLSLRLPLEAGKGYSLTLPHPPRLPRLCSILTEARVAVTPMGGALRFAGTMELGGLNARINPRRVRGMRRSIPRYFPEFSEADFSGAPVWSGLRPCSPDGLPYLGRARRYPNLIVATGHAMMGVSLAPVTGRLVAELVSGEKPSVDLALLAPERFA